MPRSIASAFVKTIVILLAGIGLVTSVQRIRAQNNAPLANPVIQHVGIVVRDINKTSRLFEDAFGIKIPPPTEFGPMTVPGNPPGTDTSRITMVHFKIGDLGIELIEPLRGPGPHPEFLEKFGPGLQHIALTVNDQQAAINYLQGKGGKRTLRTYVEMKEQFGFTFEVMERR